MLRRLRYELFDRVLRFPLAHFRKVKQAEVATMIKDEVEPLGGFIGDAFVQPVFLGGQALTALFFILMQSVWLGLVAVVVLAVQVDHHPAAAASASWCWASSASSRRAQLAGRIAESVDGAVEHPRQRHLELRARRHRRAARRDLRDPLRALSAQVLRQVPEQPARRRSTPFLFYLIGGYLALTGQLDVGALVAVIAAYKDLPGPIKELIDWDQQRQDVQIKYEQVIEQFSPTACCRRNCSALTEADASRSDGELVAPACRLHRRERRTPARRRRAAS